MGKIFHPSKKTTQKAAGLLSYFSHIYVMMIPVTYNDFFTQPFS